jgi:hypothetical protein
MGGQMDCNIIRTGNVFDHKSALICAALPDMPPCVIMDVDAYLLADPTAALLQYESGGIAIAPDAGQRTIQWPGNSTMPENSSSVMVFGKTADIDQAVADYTKAWETLEEIDFNWGLQNTIREQVAWSVVAAQRDHAILPRTLNWSRFWGEPTPENCIIYHAHGAEKWKILPVYENADVA